MVTDMGLHEKAFILAGVAPLKSAGMAKHMKHNVPGMDVPDEVMNRMTAASAAKKGKEEGIKICLDVLEQVREIKGIAVCTSWPLNGKRPSRNCATSALISLGPPYKSRQLNLTVSYKHLS